MCDRFLFIQNQSCQYFGSFNGFSIEKFYNALTLFANLGGLACYGFEQTKTGKIIGKIQISAVFEQVITR
jgi:hypothetical protein